MIGSAVALGTYGLFGAGSVALAVIDARTKRLPNRIVFPLFGVGLVGLSLASWLLHRWTALEIAVICMAVLYGLFLVPWWFGGMGFGDVKLAGLLGLYLGWLGVPAVYAGLLICSLAAAAVTVCLLALHRVRWRSGDVPYGPYLLFGAWVAITLHVITTH